MVPAAQRENVQQWLLKNYPVLEDRKAAISKAFEALRQVDGDGNNVPEWLTGKPATVSPAKRSDEVTSAM